MESPARKVSASSSIPEVSQPNNRVSLDKMTGSPNLPAHQLKRPSKTNEIQEIQGFFLKARQGLRNLDFRWQSTASQEMISTCSHPLGRIDYLSPDGAHDLPKDFQEIEHEASGKQYTKGAQIVHLCATIFAAPSVRADHYAAMVSHKT